jgi:hypothetical protein
MFQAHPTEIPAMRFLLMFKGDKPPEPGDVACKQNLPEMKKLMTELKSKGVVVSTEGLEGPEKGARVRVVNGKYSVIDGPFAEAKELIAGVCVVQVNSKQEAMNLARRFLEIAGGGESEIRQIMEMNE